MKLKKYVLGAVVALLLGFLITKGIQIYQEGARLEKEYEALAIDEQAEEKAQRELERKSNFYEKLKRGFDAKILVIGNSMAFSEGGSSEGKWTDILVKKLEKRYEVDIQYSSIASAYTGAGTGYVKLATLDDDTDYDAVILCYPATEDKEELIQYEALLRSVKQKFDKCTIISVIANSDQQADCTSLYNLVRHYGGVSVNMQEVIDEHGEDVIDHEFYPNDKGYKLYANTIFDTIKSKVTKNAQVKDGDIEPVYSQVLEYDNCIFVPIRKCRKLNKNTFSIDLESYCDKVCIQTRWKKGKKAYDIYYDDGKWLTRNELNYSVDCWYDTFLFHDVPSAKKEVMFTLSRDTTMDEIEGIYLISKNPIKIKSQ